MNKQIEWCQDYMQRNLSKMNKMWDDPRHQEILRSYNDNYLTLNQYKERYDNIFQEYFLNYLKNSKIDNNTSIRIGKSYYEIIELVEENNYLIPPKPVNTKLYKVRKINYYKYKENIKYTHYLYLYVYDDSHKAILEKN